MLENVQSLNVVWKGYSGYLPLNKIIAPSFIGSISKIFRKQPKNEPNNHMKEMNDKIKEILNESVSLERGAVRNVRNNIQLRIGGTAFPVIYGASHKITKDKNIHITFHNARGDVMVAIGQQIELDDNISYFMNEPNSFIFRHKFLINFINNISGRYMEKELKITCALQLDHNKIDHKDFFEKSVFGYGMVGEVTHFGSSDISIEKDSREYTGFIKSSDEIISRKDIVDMFKSNKFYLIARMSLGNQMTLMGKSIQNITLGVYHEDTLRSIRNYVEIQ